MRPRVQTPTWGPLSVPKFASDEPLGLCTFTGRPGRQPDRFQSGNPQRPQKLRREQWITILDQVTFAREHSIGGGQISSDPAHPQAIGDRCDARIRHLTGSTDTPARTKLPAPRKAMPALLAGSPVVARTQVRPRSSE